MKTKILIFPVVFALFLFSISAGHAGPESFYEGKNIKIIVAFKPGGGYDFYARLLAKSMEKYLPVNSVIVKNLPGAGSVIGLNRIYASKPDGLTFGFCSRANPVAQLVGIKGIKFDLSKMSWLGSPSSEIYSFIVSSQKFNGLDDISKAENIRVATGGPGGLNYLTPLLFFKMMDLDNYTLGTGYTGNETRLAVMRGEMDALFGSYYSQQSLVASGDGRIILFIGSSKPRGFEDVPFIQDIITEKRYQPLIDFLIGLNVVGRPVVGPPGIPEDRLTILRKAFEKAFYDPENIRIAKRANRPVSVISPKTAQKWVKGIFNMPEDVKNMIKEAYGIK